MQIYIFQNLHKNADFEIDVNEHEEVITENVLQLVKGESVDVLEQLISKNIAQAIFHC